MNRFDGLLGTRCVKGFIDGAMKEVALCFNGGFVPQRGERGKALKERLEKKPVSIFPDPYGKGGGGVRLRSTLIATWSERDGVS